MFRLWRKGTTYACITFGTFICSRCAGILRELNYKVKGTGVSIFNQTEIDLLDKMGNENAAKIWLAKYKADKYKEPKTPQEECFKMSYPRQKSMVEESAYVILPFFKKKYSFDSPPKNFGLMDLGASWALNRKYSFSCDL